MYCWLTDITLWMMVLTPHCYRNPSAPTENIRWCMEDKREDYHSCFVLCYGAYVVYGTCALLCAHSFEQFLQVQCDFVFGLKYRFLLSGKEGLICRGKTKARNFFFRRNKTSQAMLEKHKTHRLLFNNKITKEYPVCSGNSRRYQRKDYFIVRVNKQAWFYHVVPNMVTVITAWERWMQSEERNLRQRPTQDMKFGAKIETKHIVWGRGKVKRGVKHSRRSQDLKAFQKLSRATAIKPRNNITGFCVCFV